MRRAMSLLVLQCMSPWIAAYLGIRHHTGLPPSDATASEDGPAGP